MMGSKEPGYIATRLDGGAANPAPKNSYSSSSRLLRAKEGFLPMWISGVFKSDTQAIGDVVFERK